jgi:cellulose synthase/poly-beta-1,6-N-acetylglucosamine synthase-like glycosyltransferase
MNAHIDANTTNRLALLIPAHNEELVLVATIEGAQRSGISLRDMYLVDDSSSDMTMLLAISHLGMDHVLHVERSGKAGAIKKALDHFELCDKYDWVQIIDADSIFSETYFDEVRKHFQPGVAAVSGQVKSLKNNWITAFRAYEYTVCHDFYKTIQSMLGLITVMPGPASCFRTSVLKQIEFKTDTLTEDFDVTLQVHYGRLGKIAYSPQSVSWTQDPPTLPIYIKQVSRWYTGFFQVLKKHHVGRNFRAIDLMLMYLTLDGFLYAFQLFLYMGLSHIGFRTLDPIMILAMDFEMLFLMVGYAAIRTRRLDILLPLPLYYILRIINLSCFLWAAVKVYLLPQGKQGGSWNTGRVVHQHALTQPSMEGGVTS